MICLHCKKPALGNVHATPNNVLHVECIAPFNRAQRGLRYKCPQCATTGKVADPANAKQVWEAVPITGTPPCAYDGCRGCGECISMTRQSLVTKVPDKVCPLCRGDGWLRVKPEEVTETRVVGWKLPTVA